MPNKPYRLDGVPASPPPPAVTRDNFGRYARTGDEAGPTTPLAEPKPGAGVGRTMSGWAPGMGQNSAQIAQGQKPWPKVPPKDSAGKE